MKTIKIKIQCPECGRTKPVSKFGEGRKWMWCGCGYSGEGRIVDRKEGKTIQRKS